MIDSKHRKKAVSYYQSWRSWLARKSLVESDIVAARKAIKEAIPHQLYFQNCKSQRSGRVALIMSKPRKELSEIRAQVGSLGGKTVTPKKSLTCLPLLPKAVKP